MLLSLLSPLRILSTVIVALKCNRVGFTGSQSTFDVIKSVASGKIADPSTKLAFPSGLSVKRAKKDAKKISRLEGISNYSALDRIAQKNGPYRSWAEAMHALDKERNTQ
jgi:hypothetical protein